MLSISSCCFDQGNFRQSCKHSYLIPNKDCPTHGQTCLYTHALTSKEAPMGHVKCMLGHQVLNSYHALSKDSVIYYSQEPQNYHYCVLWLLISRELCISFRWKNWMMLNIGDAWFNNFYCSIVLFNNRCRIQIMKVLVSRPCNLHPNMSIYISGFPYNLIVMESLIRF